MSTQALPYRPLKAPPPDADRTRALLAPQPRASPPNDEETPIGLTRREDSNL
jgi:hypothetical protein